MPKIQNVGVGGYIRNPRGRDAEDSRGMNTEILRVEGNDGNSFICFPVKRFDGGVPVIDTTRYQQIRVDTVVDQVFP